MSFPLQKAISYQLSAASLFLPTDGWRLSAEGSRDAILSRGLRTTETPARRRRIDRDRFPSAHTPSATFHAVYRSGCGTAHESSLSSPLPEPEVGTQTDILG